MIENNSIRTGIALVVLATALLGCARDGNTPTSATELTADQIFSGGPIVTMDASQPSAEAIAIRNGKILAVGSQAEIEGLKNSRTEMIDLAGHTLVPGFIDGHSHFAMAATSANWANLSVAPAGNATDIAGVIAELQAQAGRNGTTPG